MSKSRKQNIGNIKVGDKVMWDDPEEGFTGIYEISAMYDKDDVWLYSSDLGTEVQVSLMEIKNRIVR
jgi:hypothetical protein